MASSQLRPTWFLKTLAARGVNRIIGVPDSLMAPLTTHFSADPAEHTIAPNEGNAVAMAAGYSLATGKVPVVYMQNSGIGNAINPLLSLTHPRVYSTPMLMLVGWRGEPGKHDEPQHLVQGECMTPMLDAIGTPWAVLPSDEAEAEACVANALEVAQAQQSPFALCVPKGTFVKEEGGTALPQHSAQLPCRADTITCLLDSLPPTTRYVATTGFTGRELYQLRVQRGEGPGQDFLNVGAMGHTSMIAFGMAQADTSTPYVIVDGDGASLMHLGTWCAIGSRAAEVPNLTHVVFHNSAHDSVGGQTTHLEGVDLAMIAQGSGYPSAVTVDSIPALHAALADGTQGLRMIVVKGKPGAMDPLMRPKHTSAELKAAFLAGGLQ